MTSPHYYVYVDNLGVLDTDADSVRSSMVALQTAFNSLGLELHGSEVSSGRVEALGCILEGSSMRSLPSSKRVWRIHHAIQGLLHRGRCMGRVLEVLVGHCTFLGLLNRMSLSVFKTVYPFIQKHYYDVTRLWPSVIAELKAFRGLVFLLVQDWWRPWNPMVTSSDASLTGFGVCQSRWPQEVVASTGRRLEKSRFRRVGGHSARESALTAAGFSYDGHAWGPVGEKTAKQLSDAGWAVDESFVEVPVGGLKRKLWSPKIWGRWKFKENIGILEARTVLKSIQRVCMTRFGHDVRHLHLCDNLGVVLSIERCRSKNFKLLSVIRRIAAFCIARNIQLAIRWVPSELNIADEPSRLDDPEVSKLLVDLIFADDFEPFSPKLPPTCTHASKADTNTGTCRVSEKPGKQDSSSSQPQETALTEHRERGSDTKDGAQACSEFARGRASDKTLVGEESERCLSAGQRPGVEPASSSEAPADHERGHRDERQWKHFIRMAGRERRRQKAFSEKQGKKKPAAAGGPGHGRGQESQCSGDSSCNAKGEAELRPEVVGTSGPCSQGEVRFHGQQGSRRDAGQAFQREVPGRRRKSLWGLCDGNLDGQSASIWSFGALESPSKLEMPEGVAKVVSISLEACLPISSVVRNELEDGGAWTFTEGSVQSAAGVHVPTSWGPTTSSAAWLGASDSRGNQLLVHGDQPDRDLGHLKDRHKGRQHHVGLDVVDLPEPNSGAVEQRKEVGDGLEVRLQRVPQCFPEVCQRASDSTGSLSSPTLRAQHRQGFKGKRLGRSDEARSMADTKECPTIRESGKTGCNMAEAQQQRSADMQVSRTSHRGYYARPRLSSHPSTQLKSTQYFADFFSGCGGVARSARALGFRTREWELLHGPSGDLTKPAVLSKIRSDISNRKIVAAMLAPPCSSFSPARDRTSVIRDRNHPWGLPNISSIKDQEKVRVGNQCLRSTLRIIGWLDKMGVPWVLENPHSSKMWFVEELITLQNSPHTHVIVTDFCQFGTRWRKRTRLLCGNLQWDDAARCQRTCLGHGICSRTNKPHFQLTGSNKHNIPWTRVAQPYPSQLCHSLAFALTAPARIVHYS